MSSVTDETLQFIADYKKHTALWDVSSNYYTNKTVRNKALSVLGEKYNLDIQGVKNKIKSLRSYFSKEHQKVKKKNTASGADEQYESPWFGYKPLLFLLNSIPREIKETEETATLLGDFSEITPTEVEIVSCVTSDTPSHTQDRRSHRSLNNKRISKKIEVKSREDKAYQLVKIAAAQLTDKDEADILGQLVAAKVRKLNPRNQAIAGNQIQNLLFNLEMQELSQRSQPTQHPSYSETPSPSKSISVEESDVYLDLQNTNITLSDQHINNDD